MTHPEKWYIPVTQENRAELQSWWLIQVTKGGWVGKKDPTYGKTEN